MRAEAEGFAPLELSLSLYPDEGRDVVFYLVKGREVAGVVADSAGEALEGAVVTLDQECCSRVVTGADGRFRFGGVLCDWEVILTAECPGYVSARAAAVAGQRDLALTLYRPATVRGVAVNAATGEGVPDPVVCGERTVGGGAPGAFALRGLPPGELKIEARARSLLGDVTIVLREGEEKAGVVVPLKPRRWADEGDFRSGHLVTIHAVEAGSGGPATGALVRGARTAQEMRTDEVAGLALVLFPPGRHRVRVGGPFDRYAERSVAFTVPDESEVTVEVPKNREATLALVNGFAQAESKFWLRVGTEVVEKRITGRTQSFYAPVDGPFDLYLEARHYMPVAREGTTVPPDGRIPITLTEGPAITGRCLGAADHPLAKVVIEVEEDPLVARMETPGDGVFRLGGLDPGRYRVLLYARNVRARQFTAEVAEGRDADLGDVRMPPPAEIVVRVLTSGDAPVRGAVVESAQLVSAKALTDETGVAVLPGRNEEETLKVHAEGFVDAWPEVKVRPEDDRVEILVRLFRPARLLVRAVDKEGLPAPVAPPRGLAARAGGPGEIVIDGLAPGPFELELEDREGRAGTLRTVLLEGESRIETLVLE